MINLESEVMAILGTEKEDPRSRNYVHRGLPKDEYTRRANIARKLDVCGIVIDIRKMGETPKAIRKLT